MDPVTLVVSALAAGALKGVGETASAAVKDAYQGLRSAVAARFAGRPAAEGVLAEFESDPETYAKPMEKHVREADLAADPRIVDLAGALIDRLRADGALPAKYNLSLDGARGVQVGDHNTQTNTFG